MKQQAITIGGTAIMPGERKYIDLPLPHLYTHANIAMPVHVIHGKKPGPSMFVCAALHGDEINGVEIIRRLLHAKSLNNLRGTLIAVPVVNVFAFITKSRYLPDRRDLNRSFPGFERGSLAGRLAYLFMEEIVSRCSHGIDLHTAASGRTNLPQIRADLSNKPELLAMAKAFNSPVILNSPLRDGSLRGAAGENDTEILLYEAGEALRFDEVPIRAGVRGILSVMRHLGMLSSKPRKLPYRSVLGTRSKWVRAPQSGILRTVQSMGKRINEGDILGYVADPFGTTEEIIRSPYHGMIIGRSTLPLVHEGEALFNIAKIDEEEDIDSALRYFKQELDPEMENPFH